MKVETHLTCAASAGIAGYVMGRLKGVGCPNWLLVLSGVGSMAAFALQGVRDRQRLLTGMLALTCWVGSYFLGQKVPERVVEVITLSDVRRSVLTKRLISNREGDQLLGLESLLQKKGGTLVGKQRGLDPETEGYFNAVLGRNKHKTVHRWRISVTVSDHYACEFHGDDGKEGCNKLKDQLTDLGYLEEQEQE